MFLMEKIKPQHYASDEVRRDWLVFPFTLMYATEF